MVKDALGEVKERLTIDNIFWIGNRGLEAAENQLIILQDEYKSGYECEVCGDKLHRIKKGGFEGKQVSVISCVNCDGNGWYMKGENKIRCVICEGEGYVVCAKCGGTGANNASGIIIPENQKGRPTTGTVVSAGECVKKYKLGDRLLVPSFAGHSLDLAGINMSSGKQEEATITILVENDILAKVHGGEIEKRMFRRSVALHTAS